VALSSVKTSTQDTSTGTPVAIIVNEDDSTKPIQANAIVGNKSTYSEVSRTGLTAADAPTGGDLTTGGFAGSAGANLGDCGNALALACRATCGTASKTLSGRLIFYDSSNNALGVSESMSFASDSTLRLGNASGDFVCPRVLIDAGQARKFRFFVDSVSGGTWAVYVRPI
jgi:hypothetical protein